MKQKLSIIGGGVCALVLGCALDPEKYEVGIFERNAALGRKFLVAGDGGLNLTHSEPAPDFIQRYTPFAFLEKAFAQFSNNDFISWINGLGIETYVGSSGRVFPKRGIKPIEVLNILMERLKARGVTLHTKQQWKGFTPDHQLLFERGGEQHMVSSDLVIFCLGGASWPVTGSDGGWADFFKDRGIHVLPFQASNCVFRIDWPEKMGQSIAGKALKNCAITCAGRTHRGEVTLTARGIEGSGIYPLSPQIRDQLARFGRATILIDLKPALTPAALLKKLAGLHGGSSYTDKLRKQWHLSQAQLALLKGTTTKSDFLDPEKLVTHLKALALTVSATGPLEEAISTVGGIALEEIDAHFELKKLPGHFVLGEMLNFDAPTGGYLLQACFTMAQSLAEHLNKKPEPGKQKIVKNLM